MQKETTRSVFRSATHFLSGTMLSRVSGMLRDMSMAFFFGTSAALSAFLLAYRFVYLIRRLFGEGLLHQGVIPQFEAIRQDSPKRGALFFRDLLLTLLCGLVLFCGIMALGFSGFSFESVRLGMMMLPGIICICLFGVTSALLQSEKKFFLSSVSPVLFNGVWIVGVLCFHHHSSLEAMRLLACTLSFAFFAQWAITLPSVWKFFRKYLSFKQVFTEKIEWGALKGLLGPVFLGIAGIASMQINSAVDGIFARFATPEGPAYLWYAIRLQQLPLALFGIALSSALLPALSRAIQREDGENYSLLLNVSIRRMVALLFPCSVGIFVLGLSSVNLLFGRGDFTDFSTLQTTKALYCYGWGLLPAGLVQVLAPAFYARKEYQYPARGFVYSSLLNILLNSLFVFVFDLGASSIAMATSFSALFNALYLLRKQSVWSQFKPMIPLILSTLFAAVGTLWLGRFFLHDQTLNLFLGTSVNLPRDLFRQGISFVLEASLYFLLFFASCKIGRVEERKHWILWKEF